MISIRRFRRREAIEQLRSLFAATLIVFAAFSGTARAAITVISPKVEVFRDLFVAGDFAKVEELIAQYRKNGKALPQDEDGKTLLHYAIQVYSTDKARLVRTLLEAGIGVNAPAAEALTPLHFAARFDCAPCAAELIAAGAEVNAKDSDRGWTPAFQASSTVLPALMKAGADIRVRDRDGNLALHWNFRREFIAAGIDVNARNPAGLTPLHFAALAGSAAGIQMLVDHGADLRARTAAHYWYRAAMMSASFGRGEEVPARSTALDLARLQHRRTRWNTQRYQPIVELLEKLERGARR